MDKTYYFSSNFSPLYFLNSYEYIHSPLLTVNSPEDFSKLILVVFHSVSSMTAVIEKSHREKLKEWLDDLTFEMVFNQILIYYSKNYKG